MSVEETAFVREFFSIAPPVRGWATVFGAIGAMPSITSAKAGSSAIRPFKVTIPEADIAAMKRRIAQTRWADAQPVADDGQGVRRQALEPLMRYWASDYDWRKVEARLNARGIIDLPVAVCVFPVAKQN